MGVLRVLVAVGGHDDVAHLLARVEAQGVLGKLSQGGKLVFKLLCDFQATDHVLPVLGTHAAADHEDLVARADEAA